MGKIKSPSGFSSLENALRLLDLFSGDESEIGITEIAEYLNIANSTAHRMVMSISAEGFLVKDKESNKYRLGASWLSLGNIVQNKIELYQVAFPFIQHLVQKSNETAQLSIISGTNIVYLCQIDSPHSVYLKTDVGMELPIHCTALGRAMLAFKSEEKVQEIINEGLTAFTSKTVTDVNKFRSILKEIKKQGYVICIEQFHEKRNSIAAPIRDSNGDVIAAVGIVGPIKRITSHAIPQLTKYVVEAANEITYRICNK